MGLLKKKNNALQASAAINDDCLIVSLPQAIEPSVWRLELDKAKNAAFEIQTEDEKYSLIIRKTARSKPDVIGQFEDKQEALEALMIVSDALKTGKSQKGSAKAATAPKEKAPEEKPTPANTNQSQSNAGVIALISTLAVIGLFYYYWNNLIPTTNQIETREITSSSTGNVQSQTGVPVSADDFLQGF